MEPIVIAILLIAAAVVLSGGVSDSSPAAPAPAYIVIQASSAEPAERRVGCLPWIIVGIMLLILLGVSQGGW